ncbi:hypothetical protein ACOMHN_039011 [Nucella lapillus]
MEEAIIKGVISKCRSRDIEALIRKWGWFTDEDLQQINFRATKRTVALSVFQLCQDLGLKQEIGDLDLLCTQMHSSSRKWTVLKMKGSQCPPDCVDWVGAGSQMRMDIKPQELQDRLTAVLEAECLGEVHLSVRSYGGATWIRVYLQGAAPFQATDVVYLLFYPNTPIIIACRMKVKMQEVLYSALQEALFEALREVFETEELSELQLMGHHLPSLADLALQQTAQGPFRKYRDLEEAEHPLIRSRSRTKERPEESDRQLDRRLKDENRHQKRRRQEKLDGTFGTHTQPQLEALEYKMELRFRGTTFAPEMSDQPDLFRCRVKFEGPSVLEGIKNLGKTGLATLPYRRHLARVQSLAKNHFTIAEIDSGRKFLGSQSGQN